MLLCVQESLCWMGFLNTGQTQMEQVDFPSNHVAPSIAFVVNSEARSIILASLDVRQRIHTILVIVLSS